jgi:hypothetical protein
MQREETALIIVCPEAELAVREPRRRYDRAAQFGVPAHITVTYPFKPMAELIATDPRQARVHPFQIRQIHVPG